MARKQHGPVKSIEATVVFQPTFFATFRPRDRIRSLYQCHLKIEFLICESIFVEAGS
jgi:hypothetical protein